MRYSVGGVSGLYIQCSPPSGSNKTGAKSWILRTLVGDKRRDIGLGGLKDLPLKDLEKQLKLSSVTSKQVQRNKVASPRGFEPLLPG